MENDSPLPLCIACFPMDYTDDWTKDGVYRYDLVWFLHPRLVLKSKTFSAGIFNSTVIKARPSPNVSYERRD